MSLKNNIMNSKIRVSYDYGKKEPYIKFVLDKKSDDLADGHLQHLIERINSDGLRLQYPETSDNQNPEIRIGCRYMVSFGGHEILQYLLENEIPHTQHSDYIEINRHVDLFNLGVNFAEWKNHPTKYFKQFKSKGIMLTNE